MSEEMAKPAEPAKDEGRLRLVTVRGLWQCMADVYQ